MYFCVVLFWFFLISLHSIYFLFCFAINCVTLIDEVVECCIDDKNNWVKCQIKSIDTENTVCEVVTMNDKETKQLDLSCIVKNDFNNNITFMNGMDAIKITPNVGGIVYGKDFSNNNKEFMINIKGNILNLMLERSALSSLINIEIFPKYMLLQLFENNNLSNKYILNRLYYTSYILLKNIHNNKEYWNYFNEYILNWDIWNENNNNNNNNNFKELQKIAKKCQIPFKNEMYKLYNKLLLNKDINKLNELINIINNNNISTTISCRQDESLINLKCECPNNLNEISYNYNINICTSILRGRAMIINNEFLYNVKNVFINNKFIFESAPIKTYERMMEKAIEYYKENVKYPSAYKICDVNRCSIIFNNFEDMLEGFNLLKKNFEIIRIKNRFDNNFNAIKFSDGYRDILFNILYTHNKFHNLKLICEIQFQLSSFVYIKTKQHKLYKIIRAYNSKSLLRNFEARKFDH